MEALMQFSVSGEYLIILITCNVIHLISAPKAVSESRFLVIYRVAEFLDAEPRIN